MTIQYIIVGFIIASATLSSVFRFFRSIEKPASKCDACSAASAGCALQKIKSLESHASTRNRVQHRKTAN